MRASRRPLQGRLCVAEQAAFWLEREARAAVMCFPWPVRGSSEACSLSTLTAFTVPRMVALSFWLLVVSWQCLGLTMTAWAWLGIHVCGQAAGLPEACFMGHTQE